MSAPFDWDCEAYGPHSASFGAFCFFADRGERVCRSPADCREAMISERQRLHQKITELAESGDEVGIFLLQAFPEPGMLLGGGASQAAAPHE